MKPDRKKDLPASVRARLLNLAKQRGEDLDLVLKRYGIERLLFRLSQSTHKDAFILKGAMLFELWMGRAHRTTKDLDLLGSGSPDIPRLEAIFREFCLLPVDSDGLVPDVNAKSPLTTLTNPHPSQGPLRSSRPTKFHEPAGLSVRLGGQRHLQFPISMAAA